jgi:hypothetical protein
MNLVLRIALLFSVLATFGWLGASAQEDAADGFEVPMENRDCHGLSLKVSGRNVIVNPGSCLLSGKTIKVAGVTSLQIPPVLPETVADERSKLFSATDDHPFFVRIPAGFMAGGARGGPVGGLLVRDSLSVRSAASPPVVFRPGVDYRVEPNWSSIERVASGSAKEGQDVLLSYRIYRTRIDTVAVDSAGQIKLFSGQPTAFAPTPPALPAGMLPLANILAPPFERPLDSKSVMPIESLSLSRDASSDVLEANKQALAKTIGKLAAGQPVKITFCGDSVACGCFASKMERSFPYVFLDKLKKRYPKSQVGFTNVCIGGANSSKVFPKVEAEALPQHPDLLIIEFVNDLSLPAEEVRKNYAKLFAGAKLGGAEVIVCLPHLPSPNFYGVKSWKNVASRSYYGLVRELAHKNQVAVADVAWRWENSLREGMNPLLLLADRANHPNDRGHEIYAEELMRCFQ